VSFHRYGEKMANKDGAKKGVPTWVWVVAIVLGFGFILQSCGGGNGSTDSDFESNSAEVAPEPALELEVEVAPEPEDLDEAILRVFIVDDTSSGLHEEFEVWIRGTGSWFYATRGREIEEAGPFPVAEPTSFFIYPQGRDSTEIEVDVLLRSDVIPGSVQHQILITVTDTDVEVRGTSIPDFEAVYPR